VAEERDREGLPEGPPDRPLVVPGFRAAGIHAGIKGHGLKDLGLIVSEVPARVAGVFTRNSVKASPVLVTKARIRSGMCRAVIVNSGNANACTGDRGVRDAMAMCRWTAQALGIEEGLVLVASTGVIGVPLPGACIKKSIPELVRRLSPAGLYEFAEAIRTTDRFLKVVSKKTTVEGTTVTVCGLAKGAGMICPNMATMLAFILTDVAAPLPVLRHLLRIGVADSFNRIDVDGDASTNDMVLLLANGCAGNRPLTKGSAGYDTFKAVLHGLMKDLARMIVRDGEGATKTVDISVLGARTEAEAKRIAYRLANSLLVKTSFYGQDMNWGRIVAAAGSCGVRIEPQKIDVWYGDVRVVKGGVSAGKRQEERARAVLERPSFSITVDLHAGNGRYCVVTSDLSHDYVSLNASYRT